MTDTILTKGKLKKITSGKEVEIVLTLNSTVSLDDLQDLKEREENIFISLGTSQMEVRDYLEPRRGYQARVDGSGVVQSISKPADEEGEQMDIADVVEEETTTDEGYEEINDEDSEDLDTEAAEGAAVVDSEESESVEADSEVSEDDIPFTDTDDMDAEDDPDAPLTFLDQE